MRNKWGLKMCYPAWPESYFLKFLQTFTLEIFNAWLCSQISAVCYLTGHSGSHLRCPHAGDLACLRVDPLQQSNVYLLQVSTSVQLVLLFLSLSSAPHTASFLQSSPGKLQPDVSLYSFLLVLPWLLYNVVFLFYLGDCLMSHFLPQRMIQISLIFLMEFL